MPLPSRLPCIIPARGGSRGIPRKNLIDLGGRPLIAWAIEAARTADLVETVYVSTEDAEIARVAVDWGASVIERPEGLATDDASSEATLLHALEWLGQSLDAPPEAFCFVQCTSPLITPADIDGAIALLFTSGADSVVGAHRENVFIWRETADGEAEPVNHSTSYRPRRQELEAQFIEAGAVYAIRSGAFLREATRYCGTIRLYNLPKSHTFEIDLPEDIPLLEELLRNRATKG